MAELICIQPGTLTAAAWPSCRHMIERAILKTGLSDFALVERDVLEGHQLLWLAMDGKTIDAASTTKLVTANGVKTCIIVACAGAERGRWLHLIEGIEAYARAEGCASVRIIGRKGWKRSLNGYRSKYDIIEKGL